MYVDNSVISIDDTPPPPATTILTIPQTLPTPQSTDHTHQTENINSQHEGSSPLSSILKNSSPEQYHNIIDHNHYNLPTTQTSNQTETKYLSSLKFLTLNVRGVFTSQHDLKHMIATNTPDIMVLTETKLQLGNKPQPWLQKLLTNYKGLQGVTRMAYSPSLWLMAIGWWNKINQCQKLKLNLTQTWGVCMSLDSEMHWSQNQWYCDDKLRKE